ncbi:MAG: hypothetical protein AAF968_06375 [Pseudomonadota bacterium]
MTALKEEITGKVRMVRAMTDRQELHSFGLALRKHNPRAAADERLATAVREAERRLGKGRA